MLGKILIIDQIATNRIAMRAKLGAAQFVVSQASSLVGAIAEAKKTPPDLIICDSQLPDGSAADFIAQLNSEIEGTRPPILVLCQRLSEDMRLSLLSAGADDVIEKPIDSLLLLARIRSHVRAAHSDAEWHLRDDTTRALGLAEAPAAFAHRDHVRLIGDNRNALNRLAATLSQHLPNSEITLASKDEVVSSESKANVADAYVLYLTATRVPEMMRLLSSLRCHKASRHAAIFVVQEKAEDELAAYALDMGANDLVTSDTSPTEIALRLSTLLERKRQSDRLRATVRTGLEAAVCDPLTGLHNRRYAMPHLSRTLDRAKQTSKPVAVMIADMDHFKRINDTHGHAAGDQVLIETAERLRENLRAIDLVARIGGEEFLIVLPGVSMHNAHKAAERLCKTIHETPFELPNSDHSLLATISIGMTVFDPLAAPDAGIPEPQTLLDRADTALYNAKEKGRNRVLLDKPAA